MFSKYPFWWDRVSIDFNGRVPGYSRRWAIIGDSTKISTFTNLKRIQIMGSNCLVYFLSATFLAFKTVRHRRNVNQEKISVHSKHDLRNCRCRLKTNRQNLILNCACARDFLNIAHKGYPNICLQTRITYQSYT